MSVSNSTRNALIIGHGASAWLPAAMIAARVKPDTCQITVCDLGTTGRDTMSARPYICRAHDLIGIDDATLASQAAARPIHAITVKTKRMDKISLPFGEYGHTYRGVGFHQYWHRASQHTEVRPLADYNLALRLAAAGGFIGKAPPGLPTTDYGYALQTRAYTDLLERMARASGVKSIPGTIESLTLNTSSEIDEINIAGTRMQPDLVICYDQDGEFDTSHADRISASTNGHYLNINFDLPGIGLHRLQTSTMRLLNFWPNDRFSPAEKSELHRLNREEADRIEDMRVLLSYGPEAADTRPALARKCQVYAARGRVPTEDYEVFSKAEWLTALASSGISPRHYDRMADRTSAEQTVSLVAQTGIRIDQLLARGTTARSAM